MQEKDITQKMLERYDDVFSDIVNVLLFNGKMVVSEDSLLMSAMTEDKRFEEIIDEVNEKEVVNMCEVLDIVESRGIEKGLEKGREEGADLISRLNIILAKEGDLDTIIKANTDKEYRNELLRKYDLL